MSKQILSSCVAMSLLTLGLATHAQGVPPAGAPNSAPPAATPAATETKPLTGTTADINGKFKVAVPVPGKARDSVFNLSTDGKTLSGSISNPYNAEEQIKIANTTVKGNQFSFMAKVGNVEFNFAGTAGGGKLAMTMISNEVVELADGSKIKTAKDTPVDGAYLVAVHAPNNSTMDNIFFLNSNGATLNGKMVRISGVRDSADFFNGTVNGNQVDFYAKNPMSTFHFVGTAEGSVLKLKMIITDTRYAVEGVKQ
ncbi:MAG: hypothetical protein QM808_08480 [Steroidobacteraceae bacterium]